MSVWAWVWTALLGLTAAIWSLSLLQLLGRSRDLAFRVTRDRVPDAPTEGPLVSIIIPARNEEGKIGPCVDGALAQSWRSLEVLVLNDRSEDQTGAEAQARADRDPRVRVLSGVERPDGWMGKVWACHTAQQRARGEYLLFIDADVRLEPEAVRQALAWLREHNLGALSAFGRLTMVTFWEWAVQPVIGGLILQNNDPRAVNDPAQKDKVMANGQFILCSRAAYDAIGGHASIQAEILDDVSFARRCKQEGQPYHMVYGRELYACRMYNSLPEIWQGWTKNLFAGLHYKVGLALGVCVALFVLNLLPFLIFFVRLAQALAGDVGWGDVPLWLGAANIVMMYASYIGGLRAADYSVRYFWTWPLGMAVTIGLFANSARRIASGRGVSWKGRTYLTKSP
jgi:glycosyltransferase involved in cell wall biosynthesis